MRGAECAEFLRRTGVFQAAPGVHVGQDNGLLRGQDLGRLGHELHPAKRDHIGVGRRGLAAQLQRIADIVGQVLDFRLLVIMRQDTAFFSLRSRSISARRSSPVRVVGWAVIAEVPMIRTPQIGLPPHNQENINLTPIRAASAITGPLCTASITTTAQHHYQPAENVAGWTGLGVLRSCSTSAAIKPKLYTASASHGPRPSSGVGRIG
jgi:hypothetical protein